jgi:hypothetical protein
LFLEMWSSTVMRAAQATASWLALAWGPKEPAREKNEAR